jgi:ubiquitin carboxyl-terminal hydrolase 9/13
MLSTEMLKLSLQGPSNPSALSSKKDGAASNQTPLEKMLMNAGPIRNDGSDKFFGMENVWSQALHNGLC